MRYISSIIIIILPYNNVTDTPIYHDSPSEILAENIWFVRRLPDIFPMPPSGDITNSSFVEHHAICKFNVTWKIICAYKYFLFVPVSTRGLCINVGGYYRFFLQRKLIEGDAFVL